MDQLFDNYKKFLKINSRIYYDKLQTLEKNNPESARAEAVVYNLLKSHQRSVEKYEDTNYGGADFICEYLGHKFLVEVTCIESETITRRSGIPNVIPESIEASTFSYITRLLRSKVSDKADQLSNEPFPRILAITYEHIGSGILFSKNAAQSLMMSDTKIRVEIEKKSTVHEDITDLKDSVFFRYNSEGLIETCRKSISAILLVEINGDSCKVYGLLHPEPAIQFHNELLPKIPFLRINPWPIKKKKIYIEWIIDDPDPFTSYYLAM